MDFVHLLLHSLAEIPATTTSMPVTHYLPKNSTTDGEPSPYLFFPQASGHIIMPAGLHLNFHPVPTYGLVYISQGNGTLVAGSHHYVLSANSFVLFDGRESFSFAATTAFEYDILYFNGSPAACFYEELVVKNGLYLPSLSSSGLNTFLRPLLPVAGTHFGKFNFHRLMTDFLSELMDYFSTSEHGTAIPDYLRQLREYLDENFYKDISLENLELLFNVNRYRICREFREHFLLPPLQYLHNARIAKAKSLLTETSLKVHEISFQIGYENTNQFIHHFKKITGWTPAAYRERRK